MAGHNDESIALQRVEKITNKSVKFYKSDLLDVGALEKIFKSHKFSSVIHFAAMKAVGESMQFPLLYYKNNLIGMINLLEVTRFSIDLSLLINNLITADDEESQRLQFGVQQFMHSLR